MDVHFDCTQCGNCCRDLKLPLTVLEAMDWLTDGHSVQIICEAGAAALARETLFATGEKSRSLAAIYRAASADRKGSQAL